MKIHITLRQIQEHAAKAAKKYPKSDPGFILIVTELIEKLGLDDDVVLQSINLMKEREEWMRSLPSVMDPTPSRLVN